MDSDDDSVTEGVKVLMYKSHSQTPEDSRNIREKYQGLIGDARRIKEKEKLNTDVIIHNMGQADELFKDVCRPQEAMYDAKLLGIHSKIVKKQAHQIQVESPFNTSAFIRKLVHKLTGKFSESDVFLDKEAWLKLGDIAFHAFNMMPKVNFIHGTFLENTETMSHSRCIREKDSKSEDSSAKVVTVSASPRRGSTDKTYAEIQRIKKILCGIYQRNGGRPVCYFRFTVDPDSFSRTIENMFHLSFLIKECEVHLSMDSNSLPVIEPLIPDGTTANIESAQSILTMNVEKWKQLIEVFEITKPSIPPSRYVKHAT